MRKKVWQVVSIDYGITIPVSGPVPTDRDACRIVNALVRELGHEAPAAFPGLELWSSVHDPQSGLVRWRRESYVVCWPVKGETTVVPGPDGSLRRVPSWMVGLFDVCGDDIETRGALVALVNECGACS